MPPALDPLPADIVGYTTLSKQLEPEEVMHMLHDLFCRFDALCTEHSVFKVETIGGEAPVAGVVVVG